MFSGVLTRKPNRAPARPQALENVRVTTSLVKSVSFGSKPSVDVLLDLLAKKNPLYYYERGDTD